MTVHQAATQLECYTERYMELSSRQTEILIGLHSRSRCDDESSQVKDTVVKLIPTAKTVAYPLARNIEAIVYHRISHFRACSNKLQRRRELMVKLMLYILYRKAQVLRRCTRTTEYYQDDAVVNR